MGKLIIKYSAYILLLAFFAGYIMARLKLSNSNATLINGIVDGMFASTIVAFIIEIGNDIRAKNHKKQIRNYILYDPNHKLVFLVNYIICIVCKSNPDLKNNKKSFSAWNDELSNIHQTLNTHEIETLTDVLKSIKRDYEDIVARKGFYLLEGIFESIELINIESASKYIETVLSSVSDLSNPLPILKKALNAIYETKEDKLFSILYETELSYSEEFDNEHLQIDATPNPIPNEISLQKVNITLNATVKTKQPKLVKAILDSAEKTGWTKY